MKRIIAIIVACVILVAGLGIVGYPFISNYIMSQNLDSEVQTYLNTVEDTDKTDIEKELKRAKEYNKSLLGNVAINDPFAENKAANKYYYDILNLDGTSVMACVEIPAINVKYPVYHGTSTKVLEKGVGHLQSSSLPVGGKGSHAVLTGHTGVSNLRIFTDLEKLKKGDMFYIYVLDQTLAYKVDNIAVVEPTDTSLLKIDENKDYVTLVTCTPYGMNSHRLLVRGTAVPYSAEQAKAEAEKTTGSAYNDQYLFAILVGACVLVGILLIYFITRAVTKKVRKSKDND